MYRRAVDLVRSSSSGDDTNSSSNKSGGKSKRKRCFIVFADVHHVDTQLAPSKKTISTANDEDEGEGITINDENDARLRKVAEYYGRAVYNHHRESNLNETKVQQNEESFVPTSLSYLRESQYMQWVYIVLRIT